MSQIQNIKKPRKPKEDEAKKRTPIETLEFKEIPGKKFFLTSGKNEIGWEGFFVSVEGVPGEKYFGSEDDARRAIDLCVFQAVLGILDTPDDPPAYTQGEEGEKNRKILIEQQKIAKGTQGEQESKSSF